MEEIGLHKLKDSNPLEVINVIDTLYPSLKGKCEYCPTKKELVSNDENYNFHFDPIHCVLAIYKH